eukprot:TRINITY_DN7205_c0_g3_i1.p2 TRINITY_DN7205_c0_g3~~TRINITY_DN7205_c0_g3_i1.p2  ORF type:complete len:178 (+),score=76.19 TRINITY_DN7205_c0_g3_i1:75-536(+)
MPHAQPMMFSAVQGGNLATVLHPGQATAPLVFQQYPQQLAMQGYQLQQQQAQQQQQQQAQQQQAAQAQAQAQAAQQQSELNAGAAPFTSRLEQEQKQSGAAWQQWQQWPQQQQQQGQQQQQQAQQGQQQQQPYNVAALMQQPLQQQLPTNYRV